jgi:mRNA-degrading endonuclease RelE of RelBE toxin-antitoxin system
MTPLFSVRTTPRYERLSTKLLKGHPDFEEIEHRAHRILSVDPHNRNGQQKIKKLEGFTQGEGQYRLRIGRWRFFYDIYGQEVVLHYCGLRREETYR